MGLFGAAKKVASVAGTVVDATQRTRCRCCGELGCKADMWPVRDGRVHRACKQNIQVINSDDNQAGM